MGLNLYEYGTDDVVSKILAYHDATDGTYQVNRFYLSNVTDTSFGYTNIVITLKDSSGDPLGLSAQTGIFYQLLALSSTNLDESLKADVWQSIPVANSITLTDIASGQEASRYFAVRTYVPRATAPKYIQEAEILVEAVEVV